MSGNEGLGERDRAQLVNRLLIGFIGPFPLTEGSQNPAAKIAGSTSEAWHVPPGEFDLVAVERVKGGVRAALKGVRMSGKQRRVQQFGRSFTARFHSRDGAK